MHYQRVLALATTDDRAWPKYWAQIGLGDIRLDRGNLPEALESYHEGLTTAERQVQADPGNAQWQYDLGISNERIGDVLIAQGNLADALEVLSAEADDYF